MIYSVVIVVEKYFKYTFDFSDLEEAGIFACNAYNHYVAEEGKEAEFSVAIKIHRKED